ncbi:MAG: TolC family protein, partial [Gemmatimonadales bacterium]|nr:TolC family protein [Gemmatimonadales bacterium]NIN10245.1 TolC family protein [Gemmatimonadales bacterium]NIN49041.1 TolC family protein [Gemmatimonadales bacterium]NIP06505.1 TolC family protein [Gemmatimonadales bacterium]NIQ98848.1 TolC family protein [Gemmatimonadales bacterium]
MRSITVLLAVAVLLGPAVGAAQQVPATMTLEEALEIALERNPAYRRAVAQADASGARVRAGVGAFFPDLRGSVSFNGSSRTQVTGQDDFGQPRRLEDPLTFRSSSASQTLSSSVTLFDGLQNLNSLRAARASGRAASAGVDLQEASIVALVSRQFYTALQAKRLIAVEERLLDVSRRQLEATERLFRVAARTEVDVLGAEVQVAQQEQELERARGDARKALLLLAEQIGLDEPIEFDVVGELPTPFDPTILDANELVARARSNSPRVARAEAEAARAGFDASAARGRRWPTISANANFTRAASVQSYDAFFDFNPLDRWFGFGLSVSVPLFTGFQTSQAIAQATASERVAQEDLREQRLQLEREVRSAFIDLVSTYRQAQLAERAVDISRRRLTMAQEQYQLGTIGFTDF